jgi:hypothetical protein
VTQNLHRLVDELFTFPAMSIPMARDFLGITYPAARALIERLVEAEILNTQTVSVRQTAYFVAGPLLQALEAPMEHEAVRETS